MTDDRIPRVYPEAAGVMAMKIWRLVGLNLMAHNTDDVTRALRARRAEVGEFQLMIEIMRLSIAADQSWSIILREIKDLPGDDEDFIEWFLKNAVNASGDGETPITYVSDYVARAQQYAAALNAMATN